MKVFYIATFTTLFALLAACSTSSESPSAEAEVPRPTGNPYQIEVESPAKAAVGQEAQTKITITPRNGFKINVDYPSKLVLGAAPEGTKLASSTITKGQMQVEKIHIVCPVGFSSESAGEKQFEGEFRFSVCNDQSCQMPRETVSWTTTFEAGAQ